MDIPTKTEIPQKRYFTMGEVARLCNVKPHILRLWESEYPQLKPVKRRGNRRYYQHHEVELIMKIRDGFVPKLTDVAMPTGQLHIDTPLNDLLARKLRSLLKKHEYLGRSCEKMISRGIVGKTPSSLSEGDAEILAAFRMRFSDLQEHLGKLMEKIAQDEGIEINDFSNVLAFAEKEKILIQVDDWKHVDQLRSKFTLDYEVDDPTIIDAIAGMVQGVAELFATSTRTMKYCENSNSKLD